jgi:hypothetical protein
MHHWQARRDQVTWWHLFKLNASHLYLMPSQSQPQRARLIRRAPLPSSPVHTSTTLRQSQLPTRPNPNLVRRVNPPISPPRTSPQPEHSDQENDEEDGEDEEEELSQKRKRGCDSLRDALELEMSKKRRKRGIVK